MLLFITTSCEKKLIDNNKSQVSASLFQTSNSDFEELISEDLGTEDNIFNHQLYYLTIALSDAFKSSSIRTSFYDIWLEQETMRLDSVFLYVDGLEDTMNTFFANYFNDAPADYVGTIIDSMIWEQVDYYPVLWVPEFDQKTSESNPIVAAGIDVETVYEDELHPDFIPGIMDGCSDVFLIDEYSALNSDTLVVIIFSHTDYIDTCFTDSMKISIIPETRIVLNYQEITTTKVMKIDEMKIGQRFDKSSKSEIYFAATINNEDKEPYNTYDYSWIPWTDKEIKKISKTVIQNYNTTTLGYVNWILPTSIMSDNDYNYVYGIFFERDWYIARNKKLSYGGYYLPMKASKSSDYYFLVKNWDWTTIGVNSTKTFENTDVSHKCKFIIRRTS